LGGISRKLVQRLSRSKITRIIEVCGNSSSPNFDPFQHAND